MSKSLVVLCTILAGIVVFVAGILLLRRSSGMKSLRIGLVDDGGVVPVKDLKAHIREQEVVLLQRRIEKLSK